MHEALQIFSTTVIHFYLALFYTFLTIFQQLDQGFFSFFFFFVSFSYENLSAVWLYLFAQVDDLSLQFIRGLAAR